MNGDLTSDQFEIEVKNIIEQAGLGLSDFRVQRLEHLMGSDGSYEIDVTARFTALGAAFLVLIECKHHRNRIKRDTVQILYDRLRAVGAHKGMIFATVGFQIGAVKYAQAHGIALVQIAPESTAFVSRGGHVTEPLTVHIPRCVGWVVTADKDGSESLRLINEAQPRLLFPVFWEGLKRVTD